MGYGRQTTRKPCFNSRPSCEGRPMYCYLFFYKRRFQFTPLMRGATKTLETEYFMKGVSIHAPHARGDITIYVNMHPLPGFNSRPSCEGRPGSLKKAINLLSFQFTPLMRGATMNTYIKPPYAMVSIHAPHARGDYRHAQQILQSLVSIHAPHARGDRNRHRQ